MTIPLAVTAVPEGHTAGPVSAWVFPRRACRLTVSLVRAVRTVGLAVTYGGGDDADSPAAARDQAQRGVAYGEGGACEECLSVTRSTKKQPLNVRSLTYSPTT